MNLSFDQILSHLQTWTIQESQDSFNDVVVTCFHTKLLILWSKVVYLLNMLIGVILTAKEKKEVENVCGWSVLEVI